MKTIEVSVSRFIELTFDASGKVKYLLGAKPSLADVSEVKFTLSDCSGWVRWLLNAASGGVVLIPDGSSRQNDWCRAQRFKITDYRKNASWKDGRLRIAFMPASAGRPGHVWLIFNGRTIECCGGRGVCRRVWNTRSLLSRVTVCYVLT